MDLSAIMRQYAEAHPEQRRGQAYFNAIHEVRPDLANAVRGSDRDPFYDDSRINAFIAYVYGYHTEPVMCPEDHTTGYHDKGRWFCVSCDKDVTDAVHLRLNV